MNVLEIAALRRREGPSVVLERRTISLTVVGMEARAPRRAAARIALRRVPLRTMVKLPHSGQASPNDKRLRYAKLFATSMVRKSWPSRQPWPALSVSGGGFPGLKSACSPVRPPRGPTCS